MASGRGVVGGRGGDLGGGRKGVRRPSKSPRSRDLGTWDYPHQNEGGANGEGLQGGTGRGLG